MESWVLLYGGSIVAIFFGLVSSFTVQLFIRTQELHIRIKQIDLQNNQSEFKEELAKSFLATNKLLNRILWAFAVFLILVGSYVVFGFFLGTNTDAKITNVTNVYENCSYPTNNIIENNYYNVTVEKYQNNAYSIDEMKYFFQKN